MKDSTNSFIKRARLVRCCGDIRLEGRADFVKSQQKVLQFLACVVGIDPDMYRNYMRCWYSNGEIAHHCRMSVRAVAKCIAKLKEQAVIRVDKEWRRREIILDIGFIDVYAGTKWGLVEGDTPDDDDLQGSSAPYGPNVHQRSGDAGGAHSPANVQGPDARSSANVQTNKREQKNKRMQVPKANADAMAASLLRTMQKASDYRSPAKQMDEEERDRLIAYRKSKLG